MERRKFVKVLGALGLGGLFSKPQVKAEEHPVLVAQRAENRVLLAEHREQKAGGSDTRGACLPWLAESITKMILQKADRWEIVSAKFRNMGLKKKRIRIRGKDFYASIWDLTSGIGMEDSQLVLGLDDSSLVAVNREVILGALAGPLLEVIPDDRYAFEHGVLCFVNIPEVPKGYGAQSCTWSEGGVSVRVIRLYDANRRVVRFEAHTIIGVA